MPPRDLLRLFDVSADENALGALKEFLAERREYNTHEVSATVAEIIARVRHEKDAALLELTHTLDQVNLTQETMRLSEQNIQQIADQCPQDVQDALDLAARRIRTYHERQLPEDWYYNDDEGNRLGMRWTPVDAAGMYVPGGKASYPSSVLMNVIPAIVAGVTRIAMTVPTPHGEVNPAVIAAARMAGVNEIYCVGGAQAVAAMAYGTETIAPVNVIAGPGNAYVAEAKRQLFGVVGIDMVAGPSEIAVVADGSVPASWVAADLLSQAEHDELAQSILITTSSDYAKEVMETMRQHIQNLYRSTIINASLKTFGMCIVVKDQMQACALANIVAAEHLELAVENPQDWIDHITHAGAIFMGRYTPEAIGDYVAGASHVLPTTQSAAFSSGLSVYNFMKKTSVIECSKSGFRALAGASSVLAKCEGLDAHALSVNIRL